MQLDQTNEQIYTLQRNETSADNYVIRNGKSSTIKQRFGNEQIREEEFTKLVGDKLNKRYSSKKRPP